jgi:NTE family protein
VPAVLRIGLVLGGGGSVGLAFHGGVLSALHEATGWDARDADVIVGTSAGSLTAGLLRVGLPPSDLRAISEGGVLSPDGSLLSEVGQPHRPRAKVTDFVSLRPPGDPVGALRNLTHPWRINPMAVWAALLPAGPIPTDPISAGLDELAGDTWPVSRVWISTVRLGDGRRVVFGRPGAPRARLGHAVAASCAIPGYFRPVTIGADRYVDGGVASMHNLDLLAGEDLDAVVVSAPMSWAGRRPPISVDVAVRQSVRLQLEFEVARLRRRGVPVVIVAPTRRVITAMGIDPMDARRRGAVSRQARLATLEQVRRGGPTTLLFGASSSAVRPSTPAA